MRAALAGEGESAETYDPVVEVLLEQRRESERKRTEYEKTRAAPEYQGQVDRLRRYCSILSNGHFVVLTVAALGRVLARIDPPMLRLGHSSVF